MTRSPSVRVLTDAPAEVDADALLVGVTEDARPEALLDLLRRAGLNDVPRDEAFRGRLGDVRSVAAPGLACRRLVLVGVGPVAKVDDLTRRRAVGAAVRSLLDDVDDVAILTTAATEARVAAVVEGALSGAYRYLDHLSKPQRPRLRRLAVVVPDAAAGGARRAVRRARHHMAAEYLARDLVNTPPAHKSPQLLCETVLAALPDGVEAEVWDEDRLAAERCGGILGVGQGSSRPPRLLILRYRPDGATGHVALVGKGIVFDTGGIDLKRPWTGMTAMKSDMAGAGAIIGAMSVLPALGLPIAVTAFACLAENMPSGEAQRPGDVLTIRDGSTVEVMNTDAEGRLVLADGLALASELAPDAIVDLATLTGGLITALGDSATGALGDDDALVAELLAAAEAAGEDMWRLPLWDDLRSELDSEVADIRNLNRARGASTIFGGLFLQHFVRDAPWVHLDIAGLAFTKSARHHYPAGGTGAMVRTLLHWLERRA